MPVRELEQWRLVRTIGVGGQGKSTLMERKNDGKLAVRKRVHDYATIRGVPTDALILQNILPSSRRIVTLTGFSFDPSRRPDNLIEWFEYCRGGDLMHAVLQSSALSEDFIWHCFIQIAEALDVLHNAGSQRVVHRDLKPENIFLEQKYRHQPPWPNLKLGDFGCATLKEHTEGLVVPLWQGPELPFLCAAGDFWALGAIVHWLAHGWPPIAPRPADFRGSQQAERLHDEVLGIRSKGPNIQSQAVGAAEERQASRALMGRFAMSVEGLEAGKFEEQEKTHTQQTSMH